MQGAKRDQQRTQEALDRKTAALLALHDYWSRDKATMASVRDGMLSEGFTLEEIAQAARDYGA